jgi:hypothetical protein
MVRLSEKLGPDEPVSFDVWQPSGRYHHEARKPSAQGANAIKRTDRR